MAVTAWGLSFVATKVLLQEGLSEVEAYIYRFIVAYILIVLISHRKWLANSWKDEGLFVICGMLSGSVYFILENTALEYTLVGNVSLLTSTSPLLTTMLIGFMIKADRPGIGAFLGSLVALVGVGCVIFNTSMNFQVNPLGDFLSLVCALCWAVYSIVLKKLNAHYDAWMLTRKIFFYGIVTALPFLFIGHGDRALHALSESLVWANLLFLAVVCSVVAFLVWTLSIKGLGAVKAGNYMYLQPVVTMIASAFLLGEAVTVMGVTGCALIIIGMWAGEFIDRRRKLRGIN